MRIINVEICCKVFPEIRFDALFDCTDEINDWYSD